MLVGFILICEISYSQNLEVVEFDSLKNSLQEYYLKLWESDREQFLWKQKGKALAHLPSVGITLGMPTVSWSTNSIYKVAETKKMKLAQLRSMDAMYEVKFNEELQNLRREYEKYLVELEALEVKQKAMEIEQEIFAIYEEAYQKQELKPLDFLQKRKTFESVKAEVKLYKRDLFVRKMEVYQLGRYEMEKITLEK